MYMSCRKIKNYWKIIFFGNIQNNFMGKEGQVVPQMSDEWIQTISGRYIDLYEKLIGKKFDPLLLSEDETRERINSSIASLAS